eukprot:361762-Chlamydomonas_euryale.AAC.3
MERFRVQARYGWQLARAFGACWVIVFHRLCRVVDLSMQSSGVRAVVSFGGRGAWVQGRGVGVVWSSSP